MKNSAILLISCKDKKGVVAEISNFIFKNNGNILHSDQHIDFETNTFFMRIEWDLTGFRISRDKIIEKFKPIIKKFKIKYELKFSDYVPKVALFVSKYDHCLIDLLARYRAGEFNCKIPLIISNHPDLKDIAEYFHIKYYIFPITKENKISQEKEELKLLKKENIDLIILARYMQILSGKFIRHYKNRIINIHHSFLPSFAGANPYKQAYNKGVKLIGATSHYVTEELDKGPIIEQEVIRVSHRDSLEKFIGKGKDIEKIVLARAVKLHLENRILVFKNKTVIFD